MRGDLETGRDRHAESYWERARNDTHALANNAAVAFGLVFAALVVPVSALVGLVPGDPRSLPWVARALLAVGATLGVYAGIVYAIAGFYFLRAPHIQRNEARAKLLEAAKPSETLLVPTFFFDKMNFLVISLLNNGPTIREARIKLIVPHRKLEQRLSRTGAYAPYDSGRVTEIPKELVSGIPSLQLQENHLEVDGYSVVEMRFLTNHERADPIQFQIGADSLKGWVSWDPVVPRLPSHFDADAFTG